MSKMVKVQGIRVWVDGAFYGEFAIGQLEELKNKFGNRLNYQHIN